MDCADTVLAGRAFQSRIADGKKEPCLLEFSCRAATIDFFRFRSNKSWARSGSKFIAISVRSIFSHSFFVQIL